MKYYYGLEDQEIYTATDQYEALEEIIKEYTDFIGIEIIEMRPSRKSGIVYCLREREFIEESGWCGKTCESYQPRNGKNRICKNHSWGLWETGRKWKITGKNELKKISGRRR